MLAMEGAEPLGTSPHLIDVFWRFGVRMASLTWNRRNPFADGVGEAEDGGLTRLGADLLRRMARLGMILDLAHASERTFMQALEQQNELAVVVSHAACRAVFDTPRNLSDVQLRALAERDGVLGIMMLPFAIDPCEPRIERVVAPIDHAVDVMGIEHVGIGGDFIAQVAQALGWEAYSDRLNPRGLGFDSVISGLVDQRDYPALLAELEARGYDDDDLRLIASGNFLRVLERSLPTG